MCKPITEVFRQGLWMRHYGSESCKHTFLWSNSSGVRHLSVGRLTKDRAAILWYDDPNLYQLDFCGKYGIQVVCPSPFLPVIVPSDRSSAKLQCPWPPRTLTRVGNAGRLEWRRGWKNLRTSSMIWLSSLTIFLLVWHPKIWPAQPTKHVANL